MLFYLSKVLVQLLVFYETLETDAFEKSGLFCVMKKGLGMFRFLKEGTENVVLLPVLKGLSFQEKKYVSLVHIRKRSYTYIYLTRPDYFCLSGTKMKVPRCCYCYMRVICVVLESNDNLEDLLGIILEQTAILKSYQQYRALYRLILHCMCLFAVLHVAERL